VKIQYITNEDGFSGLKDKWNDLLVRSASNNVFLTWEWVHTWWEAYREAKSLLLVTAEEDGKLAGIAPLYTTQARYFGIRQLRHVEFMCSVGPCSEYLDFIIERGREKDVVYAILDSLFSNRVLQWDVLNFTSINENSENMVWYKKYAQEKHYSHEIYGKRESPYIMLPASIDEFYMKLSGNVRYRLKRYKKTLLNDCSVSFHLVTDPDELESSFNSFVSLHQKRWKDKGETGNFNDNRKEYLQFHRRIASLFLQNGWLYLVFLKINNKPAAAQYNFIYCNKMSYFQAGFDPEWLNYHVGSVLQSFVLEDIISKKISEFDFLRGTEEYKYRWTKTTRTSLNMALWRFGFACKEIAAEKTIRKICRHLMPSNYAKTIYNRIFTRDR